MKKRRSLQVRIRRYLKRHNWNNVTPEQVYDKFNGERTEEELKHIYDELIEERNNQWMEVW